MVRLFVAVILFLSTVSFVHKRSTADTYIDKFSPLAIQLYKETGVPASLILAVGSVESGFGKSRHSRLLHNHFGIVGGSEKGAKPYSTKYKYFASDENSFRAFAKLMSEKYGIPGMISTGMSTKQIIARIKKRYVEFTYDEWEKMVNGVIRDRKLIAFDNIK